MTATRTKPKKDAKKKDAEKAFHPAADCCNRNSPGENHTEGCGNYVSPTPPVPCACNRIDGATAPVGEPCAICNGIVPAIAPIELPPVSPDALLAPDGQAGVEARPQLDVQSLREKPEHARTDAERIAESRKVLAAPPPSGTKFFESPDGYIEVAEENKSHVWCRHANNGKGAWINPKR